jgi:hypothetical protein
MKYCSPYQTRTMLKLFNYYLKFSRGNSQGRSWHEGSAFLLYLIHLYLVIARRHTKQLEIWDARL